MKNIAACAHSTGTKGLKGNALYSVSPARCAGSSFTYVKRIAFQSRTN